MATSTSPGGIATTWSSTTARREHSFGTFVAAGSGGLNLPEGIAFDPSGTYLYVASSGGPNARSSSTTAATGAYVGVAASAGLASPQNVTFGSDGLLYVSSGGNNRILRFTQNGTYVDDYVPAGSGGLGRSCIG